MSNLFTIDFEPWFSPRNLSGFDSIDWNQAHINLDEPTDYILNLLSRRNIKAVFFVLAYIAEKAPELITRIAAEGHEIASHGFWHYQINKISKSEFQKDIYDSFNLLSKFTSNLRIYRAPSFSITKDSLWALDILKNAGFVYSSSIYPTNMHSEYGLSNIPRKVFKHNNGLIEIPLNSFEFGKFLIPCSGGAYFRFYPYNLFKFLAKKSIAQTKQFVFYIHPWEFDLKHPKVNTGYKNYIRHYYNIKSVRSKLEKLTLDFEFLDFNRFIEYAK